jgi:hypothetical protein
METIRHGPERITPANVFRFWWPGAVQDRLGKSGFVMSRQALRIIWGFHREGRAGLF